MKIHQAIQLTCAYVISLRVSIVVIRKTGMESSIGRAETFLKETTLMIRDKAMVKCSGLTATFLEVTGFKVSKME